MLKCQFLKSLNDYLSIFLKESAKRKKKSYKVIDFSKIKFISICLCNNLSVSELAIHFYSNILDLISMSCIRR